MVRLGTCRVMVVLWLFSGLLECGMMDEEHNCVMCEVGEEVELWLKAGDTGNVLDESAVAVGIKGGEEGKEEEEEEAGRVLSLGLRNFVLGGTSGRESVPTSTLEDCLCGCLVKVMVTGRPTHSDGEASAGVLEGFMFSLWPSTITCPLFGSKINSNAGFIGSVRLRRRGG